MKNSLKSAMALAKQFRVDDSVTDIAILNFLHDLDSPRSLTVWMLYENKEFLQLVNLQCDPLDYNDAESFRLSYVPTEFLSKASFLPLGVSKRDEAFRKFEEFELLCAETNRRFKNLSNQPDYNGLIASQLSAVSLKIDKILGDYSIEEHLDCCDWGPGVTTLLKGSHVSATNKFHDENGITHDAYDLFAAVLSAAYPGWMYHLHTVKGISFQRGNTITSVPKNAKTDRIIAIEPGINLWLQKGLGKMIRRRLARFGIDLSSQKINQSLAAEGSRDSSLATIDFSSASDSISSEVIRDILPPSWFNILNTCRSKVRLNPDGTTQWWNKFSSMGNGFTFELESLIFFACASVTTEHSAKKISVYGDDVIIPVHALDSFVNLTKFMGFRVNKKKSFSSTYFRESCGSHYFNGFDCKPIYLKDKLRNVSSIYKLANNLRLYAHRRNHCYGCDSKYRRSVDYLVRRVPTALRLMVPTTSSVCSYTQERLYSDVGFFSNFDEAAPTYLRDGHEGFSFVGLTQVGIKSQPFEGTGLLLDRIRGSSEISYGNSYTLRGQVKLSVKKLRCNQWYDLGPWL
jgi:hypothetical protein